MSERLEVLRKWCTDLDLRLEKLEAATKGQYKPKSGLDFGWHLADKSQEEVEDAGSQSCGCDVYHEGEHFEGDICPHCDKQAMIDIDGDVEWVASDADLRDRIRDALRLEDNDEALPELVDRLLAAHEAQSESAAGLRYEVKREHNARMAAQCDCSNACKAIDAWRRKLEAEQRDNADLRRRLAEVTDSGDDVEPTQELKRAIMQRNNERGRAESLDKDNARLVRELTDERMVAVELRRRLAAAVVDLSAIVQPTAPWEDVAACSECGDPLDRPTGSERCSRCADVCYPR